MKIPALLAALLLALLPAGAAIFGPAPVVPTGAYLLYEDFETNNFRLTPDANGVCWFRAKTGQLLDISGEATTNLFITNGCLGMDLGSLVTASRQPKVYVSCYVTNGGQPFIAGMTVKNQTNYSQKGPWSPACSIHATPGNFLTVGSGFHNTMFGSWGGASGQNIVLAFTNGYGAAESYPINITTGVPTIPHLFYFTNCPVQFNFEFGVASQSPPILHVNYCGFITNTIFPRWQRFWGTNYTRIIWQLNMNTQDPHVCSLFDLDAIWIRPSGF